MHTLNFDKKDLSRIYFTICTSLHSLVILSHIKKALVAEEIAQEQLSDDGELPDRVQRAAGDVCG